MGAVTTCWLQKLTCTFIAGRLHDDCYMLSASQASLGVHSKLLRAALTVKLM